MITTIQIHKTIKDELDLFRKDNETYEDILVRFIKAERNLRRMNKKLLIEGCKEMAEDSLRITKEWESTDSELDWEW